MGGECTVVVDAYKSSIALSTDPGGGCRDQEVVDGTGPFARGVRLQYRESHVCAHATKQLHRLAKPVHVAFVGLLPRLHETVCMRVPGCEPVARPVMHVQRRSMECARRPSVTSRITVNMFPCCCQIY